MSEISQLPVEMSDKRYDAISDRIYLSYPNACILYIDEVINKELNDAYVLRREIIRAQRGSVKELQLFHGTSDDIIPKIAAGGFDPTKNKVSVFGYGTYFAVNANYSKDYMRSNHNNPVTYMFLADVLVGKLAQLQKKMPGQNPVYDWDNNVDNLGKPSIYTSPYPDGCFPRYVIAFHKNAR